MGQELFISLHILLFISTLYMSAAVRFLMARVRALHTQVLLLRLSVLPLPLLSPAMPYSHARLVFTTIITALRSVGFSFDSDISCSCQQKHNNSCVVYSSAWLLGALLSLSTPATRALALTAASASHMSDPRWSRRTSGVVRWMLAAGPWSRCSCSHHAGGWPGQPIRTWALQQDRHDLSPHSLQ